MAGQKLSARTIYASEPDDTSFLHIVVNGDSYRVLVPKLRDFILSNDVYTAFNGGGQASATAILSYDNLIDTATQDDDSVKLISATKNKSQKVRNISGFSINIYPQTGQNFTGLGANVPYPLEDGNTIEFVCFTNGVWHI